MNASINSGVYPTMITPFRRDGNIDFEAVEGLIAYYAQCGCDGIFALCQSSEIFFLSDREKKELMTFIADKTAGRMQLVASGHTSVAFKDQVSQLAAMGDCGADAAVIILNRTAEPHQGEDVVKRHIEKLLHALPDIRFGIYECPYPYKRMASPSLIRWCGQTGRIVFIKDTCCDINMLGLKQQAIMGTPMKIFNANTATLLPSLRLGVAGYSGIMANFHGDLYAALFQLYKRKDPLADELSDFLTMASLYESQLYPVNAKFYKNITGMPMQLVTRSRDTAQWQPAYELELGALFKTEQAWRERVAGHVCKKEG